MTGRIRPLLLAGFALAYAALAFASGRDRQTLYDLHAVPRASALAAFGHLQEARLALTQRNGDAALAAAWQGVRAAPIEPAATSLLGSAYFMKGDVKRAHSAFKVAQKLGWRDVPTQVYWLLAGIAEARADISAQHLDALMRAAPGLTQTRDVLIRLEADPAGRAALARRLAEGPGWLDDYAAQASDLPPPAFANRIALLRLAGASNRRPACAALGNAVNRLAYQAARYGDAYALWRVACAPQRTSLIGNGDFAAVPRDPPTPFDWSLPGAGGVSANIGDGALVVRNESPLLPVVAQQMLLAPVGANLRLAWQANAQYGASRLGTMVALRCPDGHDLIDPARIARSSGDSWEARIAVPAQCAFQRLELRVPREAGEVRIEKVAVELAGPAGGGE